MHRFIYCVVVGALLAPAAISQTILPASLPGWKSTTVSTVTSANLEGLAGSASAALVEYGASAAVKREYVRDGHGRETLAATLYTFQDASGAYGAFSFLRTPEMTRAEFTEHSMKSRDRVLALKGSQLLEIRGNGVAEESTTIKELVALLNAPAQGAVYPSLPSRMPAMDLIPKTDHYFLGPIALAKFWPVTNASGDWIGFSAGAEAEEARYHIGGREATLLVVDYPTPQIAATQLERISKQFKINVPGGKAGELYARRDGTLVALLAGAPSESAANSLLDKIESGVLVTWNEPTFKLHQPSMATVVVGTIIGTGEICLFTFFGGILFTLIRLGVKKMWPGKVFDRPQHLEIIQLGLSSKPIKAKDFY
ncbi:MAG TPA: DUF6599 family protein [Candidatus Acidoferrales bacterium]|nr:DUF6599 family protein [Candidatus Acidoferrales bacterium]